MNKGEWYDFPKEMKFSKYKISKDGEICSKRRLKILLKNSILMVIIKLLLKMMMKKR